MNVLIAGGSGFIGQSLQKALETRGDDVRLVSRSRGHVAWDLDSLREALTWSDALINLAGRNLFQGRWSAKVLREIKDSRVESTHLLVEAAQSTVNPPSVVINASAIGYYGSHDRQGDEDERTPPGGDVLATICQAWERKAQGFGHAGSRLCLARFGIVLGREEGALPTMRRPMSFFVGGWQGSGRQWMSWIHIRDVVGAVMKMIDDEAWSGAYNLTAPEPVTNRQFNEVLGRLMNRPCWLPAPSWALKGLLGGVSVLVLNGQRTMPSRLLEQQYMFSYPTIDLALADLTSPESS